MKFLKPIIILGMIFMLVVVAGYYFSVSRNTQVFICINCGAAKSVTTTRRLWGVYSKTTTRYSSDGYGFVSGVDFHVMPSLYEKIVGDKCKHSYQYLGGSFYDKTVIGISQGHFGSQSIDVAEKLLKNMTWEQMDSDKDKGREKYLERLTYFRTEIKKWIREVEVD